MAISSFSRFTIQCLTPFLLMLEMGSVLWYNTCCGKMEICSPIKKRFLDGGDATSNLPPCPCKNQDHLGRRRET